MPGAAVGGGGTISAILLVPMCSIDESSDTTVPAMVKAGPLAPRVDPAAMMLFEESVMAWLPIVKIEAGLGVFVYIL